MPDNDNDFDRQHDREEEEADLKFSANVCAQELASFKQERCCVFMKGFESGEVLHGRIIGFMKEFEALVIRDIRVGREHLQTKSLIPSENVEHVCVSMSLEKCRQCNEFREMERDAAWDARRKKRLERELKHLVKGRTPPRARVTSKEKVHGKAK